MKIYQPRQRSRQHKSVLVREAPDYPDFIDVILYPEDKDKLYEKWDAEKWGTPVSLPGGVEALTVQMVLDVPKTAFSRALGAKTAKRIRACAEANKRVDI